MFQNYLMTKSQYAFTFSCEKLFREWDKVYFWTFTFIAVPWHDDLAMEEWNMLNRRLHNNYWDLKGVRVVEMHRSHGIHFHCFVNKRLPVDEVRKIIEGNGRLFGHNCRLNFGRIDVEKCDKSPESIAYLSLYLSKQYRSDNWFGRRRRWGAMGGFRTSRCCDIEYDSVAIRNRREIFRNAQCSYTGLMMCTHFSNLWGAVKYWPIQDLTLVMAQPTATGSSLIKHRMANEPF